MLVSIHLISLPLLLHVLHLKSMMMVVVVAVVTVAVLWGRTQTLEIPTVSAFLAKTKLVSG